LRASGRRCAAFACGGVFDQPGLVVQRDGRADVARDAVEAIADGEFAGARRFDDEVFLAVHDGGGVGKFEQAHARVWVLRGDGFIAEVEAKTIGSGPADDAREQHRRGLEGEFREFVRVTEIPEYGGAGTQFAVGVFGVQGEGRRAPGDERHVIAEMMPQREHRCEGGLALRSAGGGIGIVNVAVVGV